MKPISVMLLIVVLVLAIDGASAQTSLDDKTYTDPVPSVQKGDRSFNIKPSYVLKDLTAGRDVEMTVAISAPSSGSSFLELKGVPVISNQDAADKFHFTSNGMDDNKGVVQTRIYHYIVRINDNAEPRRHQVRVDFGYPEGNPDKEIVSRFFYLIVGVNSGGRLVPHSPDVDSQLPLFETGFLTGKKHTYELNLRNSFPDYTVSIESIKIQSDPPGLIVPKEFIYENGISLTPSEVKTIPLEFETTPLGLKNLIKGLGTMPRFRADIFYNDGNERRITDFKPRLPISIPPTSRVLLGSVFLGLLFGALIRALLEFKLFKKQLTRRGVIKVVSYSLIFGMVMVILVAAGQIEIKAKTFAMSSSYDNPLTMLIIGLIGALAGLQMIIGWYKSLKAD